ncbi:carbon-nitrogen hydrolase family protein [Mycolicibacterium smegmatis]|uniref:Nitrilase/cyanide hydratase and apolipoprotein N-acyltransferase n=3 Tax=Mycolicibacterium smegmatis TaxID=1772 RepID=A0QXL6_MYCS2|nr:carbon-nitrogen hydrolase family protein [Mycolicibacterium smegmatis]ABK75065.1 nitrilase/cyanide hydratase and apolipoprotein N-acyltransferase [Mycolicibacterium smegmatis MC2 155]AFP39730.1 Nitrilase/cyanide hydratase and apolipoprotein N-acyltransferase [Mycolicibacterium smegmatis MC2 155]AIU08489.1 hydrolase [Mycolicibacterium smegmatis MC2 155]AIU15114.1 hydrolase [Mycolicibacterium smegmatis]AIU21737.1 hydrolase [Mycolicibacterium smegmatis]
MTLTAAVAQFAPSEDKAANLDTIVDLLRQAADQNADLVVLPEYAVFTVPTMDDRFVRTAEALDGSSVTRLAQAGAELGLTVIAGINESAGNGKIHNTLVGIQGGEIAAVYRKVHLYDAFGYKESDRVIAADPAIPQLLRVNGFTIGMQTCYDLRFPETSRALVDAGADVIALPAEWVPGPLKEYHWNTLLRARAIENTVYVVAADQIAPAGSGNSVILDPMGIPLAALGEAAGIGVARLERSRLESVRTINPALALRRFRVQPEA